MAKSKRPMEVPRVGELTEPESEGRVKITPGSVDDTVRRLARWCRLAPSGIARVEFSSEPARLRAVDHLRRELEKSGIAMVEARLPRSADPSGIVSGLLLQLSSISGGVVNVSGFESALQGNLARPSETTAHEWIWQLNFNRESLANRPLRQIWWMTPGMAEMFGLITPDIDSWFSPKLALTETLPIGIGAQSFIDPYLPDVSSSLSAEAAREESSRLMQRFRHATNSGAPANELLPLFSAAVKALVDSGLLAEANELRSSTLLSLAEDERLGRDEAGANLTELGRQYSDSGRYTEAESALRRALDIANEHYGSDHYNTAAALSNLANLYSTEARYTEAESLYRLALDTYRRALGPDDPRLAVILSDIGSIYAHTGRYDEARIYFGQALESERRLLGNSHSYVATTLMNIAGIDIEQGRYTEAEPLLREALAIREQVLGPDHPATAVVLTNLGSLYAKQGRYAEAEPLYERAVQIDERTQGLNHPSTAFVLCALANLYADQKLYSKAEPLYIRALEIQGNVLGPDHPEAAGTLLNFGTLFAKQGKYAEAEPMYRKALEIFNKTLGPDHPYTAKALEALSFLLKDTGRT